MTAIHSLAAHGRRPTPVSYAPLRARSVLVPVDGSSRSFDLLRLAVECARDGSVGEIHAVCVSEELNSDARLIHRAFHPNSKPSTIRAKLESRLDAEGWGDDVEVTFAVGTPATAIAATADRLGCDLILLARESRNPLARWFSRGLSERVMQRATCPVLVVCGGALAG